MILLHCYWIWASVDKTVITLTAVNDLLFDSFDVHKILVIAPLRVARFSWSSEIRKWMHLNDLIYSVVVGTESERLLALKSKADIYIINRENIPWLIEKSGVSFDFDMLIVDELSSFKNWQSKRFRSIMKVRPKITRIVGLTGTPSSNGLMDLFAEFRLLDMGERLGRFIGQYRNAYFKPDKMNGPIVYSYKLLPGAEQQIYNKISDITISMKSTDHLTMPELVNSNYDVYLDEKEKERYEELKKDLVLQLPDGEITAANAAALSGKLCQMANGAIYTEDSTVLEIHDKKLDALEDIVEAANGKPILLIYWFRHDLDRISKKMNELKVPYAKLDTDASIRKWNKGELTVALLHPMSGGHGLNLQSGGSTIIWFGMTWSLELYQQTIARLWRQGQTSKTVVVQHIIAKGTIDERILKALSQKDNTQSALIDAVKANLQI